MEARLSPIEESIQSRRAEARREIKVIGVLLVGAVVSAFVSGAGAQELMSESADVEEAAVTAIAGTFALACIGHAYFSCRDYAEKVKKVALLQVERSLHNRAE